VNFNGRRYMVLAAQQPRGWEATQPMQESDYEVYRLLDSGFPNEMWVGWLSCMTPQFHREYVLAYCAQGHRRCKGIAPVTTADDLESPYLFAYAC
jgi:hypothetical protein